MVALLLDSKSWHFRLATVYGTMRAAYPDEDLCSYVKSVLKGLLLVLFLVILGGGILGFLMGNTISWIVASSVLGIIIEPNPQAAASIDILGVSLFWYILHTIDNKYPKDLRWTKKYITAPSFIREAYSSFKEKTCVRLSFLNIKKEDDDF